MAENGGLLYAALLVLIATVALFPNVTWAQYTCGSNNGCSGGTCPSGEICASIKGDIQCAGGVGHACETSPTSLSSTTVATTSTTASTSTVATTTTSVASTTTTAASSQSTTTVAQGSTTPTTTVQGGGGPTLPTTSVSEGVGGHVSTTIYTSTITTTIAPVHGSLILRETGLPSGVLFAGYLESDPTLVYATNTSVNGSIQFPEINTGPETYVVLNVTLGNSTSGGFIYQPVPSIGTINITENQTSTQDIRFVAVRITTTTLPTTTVASQQSSGVGGVVQGVLNAIEGFFSYLFGGK